MKEELRVVFSVELSDKRKYPPPGRRYAARPTARIESKEKAADESGLLRVGKKTSAFLSTLD
jgi:hypothetical protein